MKRVLATIFVLCMIAVVVTGCGKPDAPSEGMNITFTSDVPCKLPYNDKAITLLNETVYQDCNKEKMYSVFVVLEADVSELTDDELYWLLKEDLEVSVRVTSGDNRLDFYSLGWLGTLKYNYEDDTPYRLYITFWDSSYHRFSFSGADISVWLTAKQLEKYEYTNDAGRRIETNRIEEICYNATIGNDLESIETIREPLYGFVLNWLEDRADFYGSLLD